MKAIQRNKAKQGKRTESEEDGVCLRYLMLIPATDFKITVNFKSVVKQSYY